MEDHQCTKSNPPQEMLQLDLCQKQKCKLLPEILKQTGATANMLTDAQ